jgi:hypothetical protein
MAATPPPQDRGPTGRELRRGASRGRLNLGGAFRPRGPRNPRAVAVALAAHLVLGIVLLRTLTFNTSFRSYFGFDPEPVVQEQLTFVETAPEPPPERTVTPPPPRDPGILADRNAVSRGPELAPPDAPVAVPRRFVEAGDTVAGRVRNAEQAAVVGVKPGGDPRLWTTADVEDLQRRVRAVALGGGVPGARELDSVITYTLLAAKDSLDSLAVLQNWGPTTASWTKKDSKGGLWGMDEKGIRLGKVTIPSALLGFLPMGAQQAMSGNPINAERQRRLAYAQSDIARFRQSGPGNDMFKMLVEELRERKDREREARRRANAKLVTEQGEQQGGVVKP